MSVALPNRGRGPGRLLALAGLVSLTLGATEPGAPMPGLAPNPLATPGLPVREPWDPGPPDREPEERIEADPAWSRPSAPSRTRTSDPDPGSGTRAQVTVSMPGLDLPRMMRLMQKNLIHGAPLPFFKEAPGERVGQIKYFYHETICKPPMRHLTWGRHGILHWVGEAAEAIRFLTPAGLFSTFTLDPNRAIHALGRNQAGDLVYFGDREWGIVENRVLDPKVQDFSLSSARTPGAVSLAVPGVQDDFWILGPAGLRHWDAQTGMRPRPTPGPQPWFSATSLAPLGDGNGVVAVCPDSRQVFKLSGSGRSFNLTLEEGTRPHATAPGPKGETWVTVDGHDQYLVLEAGDGDVRVGDLVPPDPAGPRGLRDLTLGPDGNMWFALAGVGALMRVSPDGAHETFRLLPGDVPGKLVRTDTGILFPVENSCRIGFIRALPVSEDKGWTEPIREPRPVREKKLSREQAHALHDARLRRAQERAEARLADLEAAGRGEAGASREAKEAKEIPESKQPRPEAAAPLLADPDPSAAHWNTLAGLGVHLHPGDIRHILDGHAHDSVYRKPRSRPGHGPGDRRQPGKGGRFAAVHSTDAGQLALLARALGQAGEIGRITDDRGRFYTKCQVPEVGCYHSHDGTPVATDCLVVVMDRAYNEQLDDFEYGIVTAFTAHPNW